MELQRFALPVLVMVPLHAPGGERAQVAAPLLHGAYGIYDELACLAFPLFIAVTLWMLSRRRGDDDEDEDDDDAAAPPPEEEEAPAEDAGEHDSQP